ncbi:MAG: hypothetical protein PVH87_28835 [Desulfobacteraceae bacterium]|jgi:hypothetical protein
MPTSPIRLNPSLLAAAEREGRLQKRSTPKQIEFWADLGRAVERVIDLSDLFAVLQGLKRLKLENVESVAVEPEEVFSHLQKQNDAGRLSSDVTTTSVYYEASKQHPGMLDRVNAANGVRHTGQFRNGVFEPRI